MKPILFFFISLTFMVIVSCNSRNERYVDLNTGEYLDLKTDSSGLLVSESTGEPAGIYVDTKSHDTIYGRTGKVVNGRVTRIENGKWEVKRDGDEMKAVNGDDKMKSDGDESKTKEGSVTRKVEKDGDIKIEDGHKTIKIDGKTGERKVKKDHNITDKVKKVFN